MPSSALRGFLFFFCAAILSAQVAAPQPQRAGLEADWDIGAVLNEIGAHAGKMLPMLEKIDAASWVAKGAPDAYAAQLQSSKDQARALADGAKIVARHPEQLSASLEIYFRVQGLETMVGSLSEAIGKYQTPSAAQALIALTAENGANRDRLQRYLVNLAAERERDLQIMDREAQRCRGMLTEQPARPGKKK